MGGWAGGLTVKREAGTRTPNTHKTHAPNSPHLAAVGPRLGVHADHERVQGAENEGRRDGRWGWRRGQVGREHTKLGRTYVRTGALAALCFSANCGEDRRMTQHVFQVRERLRDERVDL